ncbi:MAG: hypothetical protein AB1461_09215 [Thermodesulfobacteriota bacterium]
MSANDHLPLPDLTGLNFKHFSGFLIFNLAQFGWKLLVKDAMKPADEITIGYIEIRIISEVQFNRPLAGDMSEAFYLQVTLGGITGIVLVHSALNIDRVSAVPLNEVGIIAIDEAQQFNDRLLGDRVKLSAKGG